MEPPLKVRTANTLKWNLIDRLMQQLLYAVTGIVLARMLSQEDFGLVGAVMVFQAFALLLVDSGFSYAIIQRKNPTQTDYSTVLWFNVCMALLLYAVLWLCAPLIADCFQHDERLTGLSRVLFLVLPLNAAATVQTNRLQKLMTVRPVAVANGISLAAGALAGIYLAISGYGAWAVVWQTIVTALVRAAMLWSLSRWLPSLCFSMASLRSLFCVGGHMMFTSFLNTVFLNLYSFIIGSFVGLRPLGYYTQSDKWSKMGIMSIYQTLTSSFLPALSAVQDDRERFCRLVSKMNRFTAYITFPVLLWLMALATPVFHLLFGTKWDPSIYLFQLLLLRGIFTVLNGLYGNYMLALGHSRPIMWLEVLRDCVAVAALALTFPYMALSTDSDPVYGLRILLYGQLAASATTFVATIIVCCRYTATSVWSYLRDMAPYLALTLTAVPLMLGLRAITSSPLLQLLGGGILALTLYVGISYITGSKIQRDVFAFLRGKPIF